MRREPRVLRGSDIRPAGPVPATEGAEAAEISAAQAARVITMTTVWEDTAARCINNNRKVNLPSLQHALISPNYARLWYGQAVSAVGDSVFATTLVLWVSQDLARGRSWAPAAVS